MWCFIGEIWVLYRVLFVIDRYSKYFIVGTLLKSVGTLMKSVGTLLIRVGTLLKRVGTLKNKGCKIFSYMKTLQYSCLCGQVVRAPDSEQNGPGSIPVGGHLILHTSHTSGCRKCKE